MPETRPPQTTTPFLVSSASSTKREHPHTSTAPATEQQSATQGGSSVRERGKSSPGAARPPWIIRTYAGFGDARQANARFLRNLKEGQRGLSIAFDLPTQNGYDPDAPIAM